VSAAVSMALPEPDYAAAIENTILSELERGPATFAWIAEHAEGAFPSETRVCLDRMISDGRVRIEDGLFIGASAAVHTLPARSPITEPDDGTLPSPHPADYDWRFTPRTARLIARLARVVAGSARIGLFGTPTVYQELLAARRAVELYERNVDMVRCLPRSDHARATEADLLGFANVPAADFGVVVADPPWYPEYYRAFAQHAALALKAGGVLLLSVLPRLTRPGAEAERHELLEHLLSLGFELSAYYPNKLRYRTPPFERLSLHVEDLACGDWRRGDLGIFRLGESRPSRERLLPLRVSEPVWDSFRLALRRVRVRRREWSLGDSFWYLPLGVNGPVLPTVSRRHGVRNRIDVWSDLNEAWEVSRVDLVRAALRVLEVAPSDPTAAARTACHEANVPEEDVKKLAALLKDLQASPSVIDET
jgi:hypothetical protein